MGVGEGLQEWTGTRVEVGSPEGPHRSLGPERGERGRGARRPVSEPGTRTPPSPTKVPRSPAGSPKGICRGFRSPRFLPARPPAGADGWEGRGPLRSRGAAAGVGGAQYGDRGARGPGCPRVARALTVRTIALPRAGHLLRAQAALGSHREAAQHVGGREQVRLLHAAPPGSLRRRHSRGRLSAGILRGGLGPRRAPREARTALEPSPTAVAAAAPARARMLRPGLPPRGGAARGPPPHSHPFRPPSEPSAPPPQGPGARRLSCLPILQKGELRPPTRNALSLGEPSERGPEGPRPLSTGQRTGEGC